MATRKEAKIIFKADDREYRNRLKQIEYQTKRATEKLEKYGSVANRVFLGTGAAIGGLIKLYRQQEQAEIGVAAAIKQVGKEHSISLDYVKQYSSALQDTSTFGDEAAIQATTLALRLGNLNANQLPRAVRLFADFATTMGKDLPSAAQQLSRYLADPTQGVTRLAQAGITLTKSQADYVRELYRSGKVMESQNMLMTLLEEKFGGASKAALEGTGILLALKNALGDVGEQIGKILFEWIRPLVETIFTWTKALKENSTAIEYIATALKKLLILAAVVKVAVVARLAFVKLTAVWHGATAALGRFTAASIAARIGMKAFWATATLGLVFLPEIYAWLTKKIPGGFKEMYLVGKIWLHKLALAYKEMWGTMFRWAAKALTPLHRLLGLDDPSGEVGAIRRTVDASKRAIADAQRELERTRAAVADRDEDVQSEVALGVTETVTATTGGEVQETEASKKAREARIQRIKDDLELTRMRLAGEDKAEVDREARRQERARARLDAMQIENDKERELTLLKIQADEDLDNQTYQRKQEREEDRREAELAKAEYEFETDLEAERMRQEGRDEQDIEFYERRRELEAERRELEREEQELREAEADEHALARNELDLRINEEHMRRLGVAEKAHDDKRLAARKKQMQTELTENLRHLQNMFGQNTAFGKALFLAEKAIAIANTISSTHEGAGRAYANAMATYPPPANVGVANAMRAITLAGGYAQVAMIAATAIQGVSAQTGGMVPGNPAYGDINPYLLQAGEVVVPRKNYEDLKRGILREDARSDYEDDWDREQVIRIELSDDAARLVRQAEDEQAVLGI